MRVILGTHPIPQKYFLIHKELNTWHNKFFEESIKNTMADEAIRLSYD